MCFVPSRRSLLVSATCRSTHPPRSPTNPLMRSRRWPCRGCHPTQSTWRLPPAPPAYGACWRRRSSICQLTWRRRSALWWCPLLCAARTCRRTLMRCASQGRVALGVDVPLLVPAEGGWWVHAVAAEDASVGQGQQLRRLGPTACRASCLQFMHWTDAFTSKLGPRTKMVGSALTCEGAPKGGDAGGCSLGLGLIRVVGT